MRKRAMHEPDMITAFNDCVERVLAGEPVERCLQDYPTLAAVLRPMLEAALSVRRSAPPVPVAAKARVGARVMQQAERLGYMQTRRPFLPRLTWAAAVLAMVLFAGVLGLWWRRAPQNAAAPSPSVGVTALASLTPTLSATPSPSATASASPTHTPTATASLTAPFTLTPSATASPTPTLTPTATASLTPTPTATPTFTATTEPCEFVIAVASANLRSGPGIGYPVVGTASQGERFRVLARHVSGEWYEVARAEPPTQVWVAAVVGQLEGACDGLPTSDLPLHSDGGGASGGVGGASVGASGASDGGAWTPPPAPNGSGTPDGGMFGDDGYGGGYYGDGDNGNGDNENGDNGDDDEEGNGDENGDGHVPSH